MSFKGATVSQIPISGIVSPAIYQPGFLGGCIKLKADDHLVSIRFLKSGGITEFLNSLNSVVCQGISTRIDSLLSTFQRYGVQSFPRDSHKYILSCVCEEASRILNQQDDKWDECFDESTAEKARFLASHHPVDMDELRSKHEAIFLVKRESFLKNVESNPLTHEQRLAVLRSNDKNMVLAAAGTGKTSVIVAKALDLIDRKLAQPHEILVLAYNKDATTEIETRLADKAIKSNITLESLPSIATFHSLGRKVLRDSGISTYMSVFTEDTLKLEAWITEWITKHLRFDIFRVYDFIEISTQPLNPFDINTKAEYERYIRDNEFRTLNGEQVKGYQELLIANYLFANNVPYTYEAPYVTKRRIDVGFDYRPDFYLNKADIYIEHFGIDRQGSTRPDIDAIKYNESINKKRKLHEECGTVLIETFHYDWCEDALLQRLESKLAEKNVHLDPMDPDKIFDKLQKSGQVAEWAKLLTKALQAIRVERLDKDSILSRLANGKVHSPAKYADLLDELHRAYIQELNNQNSIDFDDMIIRAIHALSEGKYKPEWKYILVDEFQDISAARMEFIQALIDKGPEPSLTVVGDDWQSIYRFSGGKLELTTRFGELVGSYTETKLQKTFRYNNSIANTAGIFIMENPEQFKKEIVTHTKVSVPQIYLLDDKVGNDKGVYERVIEVVRRIRENDLNGSISIIARYNYLLKDSAEAVRSQRLGNNVNFWSFHKSKGLEADYCILIGFFQGKLGFPNENRNQAMIEALLPTLDSFPHSEERRLLYVGITRARHKSYLIADPTAPSEFITEILAPKYEVNIVSKTFQEQYRKIFKCPNCTDGYLRLVKGKFGDFYVCSTGNGCSVGKARICNKCKAPSVDHIDHSVCNNLACRNAIRICDKCGRPMALRESRHGKFWGCTGYGIKDDQCKNTRKL